MAVGEWRRRLAAGNRRPAIAGDWDLAVDPSNPLTIYAGTGEENFNIDAYYGAGILKSVDGGIGWTQLAGNMFGACQAGERNFASYGSYIGGIAVNPVIDQLLLAAVNGCPEAGVYISGDAGATWELIPDLSGTPGTSVLWVGGATAYAALGYVYGSGANGVYVTNDFGETWNPANGTGRNILPSGVNVGRIALAAAPSNPLILYAALASPDAANLLGLYKTVDGGMNWTPTNAPDFCSPQCFYNLAIAVSPVNPDVVYATGIYQYPPLNRQTTVIATTDGGDSWVLLGASTGGGSGRVHTDGHALAFTGDGARLYVGSDGGLMRGDTPADPEDLNWESLNATLATIQFYPGFVHVGAGTLGGTQDNGTLALGLGARWNSETCGDGGFSGIDTEEIGITFYTACAYLNRAIYKTDTPLDPKSWTLITNGINFGDPAVFIPPMVVDTSRSNTLYYGTNQVYQTINSGGRWDSISPQPLPGSTGNVSAIAPLGNVIYAGTTDSQVVRTFNGGTTWTNVTSNMPPRYVTDVAVDPRAALTAYATFSGFSGFVDNLGHVFRTNNGGMAWTDISGNLPNIPVNDLVIDTTLPNTFYAATDIGVFVTNNGGGAWNLVGTNLPNVAVLGLFLDQGSRQLAAATHGRGAWVMSLSAR